MRYLWTEDTGAGLHYWQLTNKYLFQNKYTVESKGSNQGLLNAVRTLIPQKGDTYFLAFDIVFDNMDIVNKYQELQIVMKKYPEQIIILDMLCFEYIILDFVNLVEWTGTRKTDKIAMRKDILSSIAGHRINLAQISSPKTREYLMGFKYFSTERVIKSIVNELTENDMWQVKGKFMGDCWHQDCCATYTPEKTKCHVNKEMSGAQKITELFMDTATQNIIHVMK